METVVFLNTYLITPTLFLRKRQSARYPKILPFIVKKAHRPSIIGLAEVFRGFCGKMSREAEKFGYESICDTKGFVQTSGLMLLWNPKKWEKVSVDTMSFSKCSGVDCFANKGILVVKLYHLKKKKHVYFIVTHLNANQEKKNSVYKTQINQIKLIDKYIKENIGENENVVIMGDFNVDITRDPYKVVNNLFKLGDLDVIDEYTTNEWGEEEQEILDYIITRNLKHSNTKIIEFKNELLSDHNVIQKKINIT